MSEDKRTRRKIVYIVECVDDGTTMKRTFKDRSEASTFFRFLIGVSRYEGKIQGVRKYQQSR